MRLSEDGNVGKVSLVDALGARLAVFVSGGTQDPVVLLHGGPGVPDYLAEVAEILAPRHRVIRYAQRGTPAVASESRHIP